MRIVRNSMITPDGTELISRHRHDHVTHIDKVSGEEYMVDGGCFYYRRSVNDMAAVDTSLDYDMEHELLRRGVSWGKRLSDGGIGYITIKNMSLSHIQNIIKDGYKSAIVDVMRDEVKWRLHNEDYMESEIMEKKRESGY